MDDLAAAAAATTTTAANRGTAQFEAVDAETRAVMQSRINPSSRAHYDSENTKFILWLFDNREHYNNFLQPALLNKLALQLERDKERRTQAGKPSKRRDHVRATCRQWLGGVKPSRPETCPIWLTDLDIQVYGCYLNAFKKRVDRRLNGGTQAESVLIRLSQSAFEAATSALAHLYPSTASTSTPCRKTSDSLSPTTNRAAGALQQDKRRISASARSRAKSTCPLGRTRAREDSLQEP